MRKDLQVVITTKSRNLHVALNKSPTFPGETRGSPGYYPLYGKIIWLVENKQRDTSALYGP